MEQSAGLDALTPEGALLEPRMNSAPDFIDQQGYRANVGIVLMREGGQLFLGGRSGGRGWQFPQGGVRRGEAVDDALFRELNEEIGLKPEDVEVVGRTRGWLRYRLPMPFIRRDSVPMCIGQKQRWYLLRLCAAERQLRFDATDQPPEFDRWRWVDYWEPIREVIYFKRHVYSRALHELGDFAFPQGLPPYPEWWTDKVRARSRTRRRRPRVSAPD